DNDVPAARELAAQVDGDLEVVVPTDLDSVRETIAGARLLIGSRMHACLNALSVGTPAIPLAYSRKFAPLLDSVGWTTGFDLRTAGPPRPRLLAGDHRRRAAAHRLAPARMPDRPLRGDPRDPAGLLPQVRAAAGLRGLDDRLRPAHRRPRDAAPADHGRSGGGHPRAGPRGECRGAAEPRCAAGPGRGGAAPGGRNGWVYGVTSSRRARVLRSMVEVSADSTPIATRYIRPSPAAQRAP